MAALAIVCVLAFGGSCFAGGGPENVFVLVNSNSADSMRIANHYVDIRQIPATNVLYIPYEGSKVVTSGKVMREQFLLPTLAAIKERKLGAQIDYIVYSSDFPYRIGLASDFPDEKFPTALSPRGALTGMTFLQLFVLQKRTEVVSPNANLYFRKPMNGISISRAFRSTYRWGPGGKRTGANGLPYVLSSMLGVTDQRGNKVEEVIASLERSKHADGTQPKGTVYFMKHDGPRSKPRHDLFAAAATELRRLGVSAKVLDGKFPSHKGGIIGLTCGVPFVDFRAEGVKFLPGAFCDNLTSYGGLMTFPKKAVNAKTGKKTRSQVSVTDFIRYGATAASGTTFEPLAIQQKFPIPSVHVHYAAGCSLGEAFYQSVSGPYQQLLVGDPLCQPWAKFPQVKVEGLGGMPVLRGEVSLNPTVTGTDPPAIKTYELFINGVRTERHRAGEKFTLDTTKLQDGHHELRVVATVDNPIETQGRLIANVIVKNGRNALVLSTAQKNIAATAEHLTINVVSTSSEPTQIVFHGQTLAEIPTGSGQAKVPLSKLGAGPVEIVATSDKLRSPPLRLLIAP